MTDLQPLLQNITTLTPFAVALVVVAGLVVGVARTGAISGFRLCDAGDHAHCHQLGSTWSDPDYLAYAQPVSATSQELYQQLPSRAAIWTFDLSSLHAAVAAGGRGGGGLGRSAHGRGSDGNIRHRTRRAYCDRRVTGGCSDAISPNPSSDPLGRARRRRSDVRGSGVFQPSAKAYRP